MYGKGARRLARDNSVEYSLAIRLKHAYLRAVRAIPALIDGIRAEFDAGMPIVTWGGRRYYCEPPQVVDGRKWTFEYRGINLLVQASAADAIKESMIRAHAAGVKLILSVHDQLVALADEAGAARSMELLKQAMESVEFVLPMPTDGKVTRSWGN
jgi:DNA polymerase I-like protein with 3'-5' exonuclease and polymerase domains